MKVPRPTHPRWAVFVQLEGKVGHRWYLWVFHSSAVVHYVLDASRAAEVVQGELAGVQRGIISCDRYSAYKCFARLTPGVVLAFCWAHQRRDFLELANAHPDLSSWALAWVDAIGELYRLNELRLTAEVASSQRSTCQAALEQAVHQMACRLEAALSDSTLAQPAVKVLQSMKTHWPGLTVFVKHPWVPMGRVEMWRGDGRSRHRCFRPFRLAVPYEPDRGSVSTSPSSNRTCATNASNVVDHI